MHVEASVQDHMVLLAGSRGIIIMLAYVTCYEKRDHWGFFINIEFLVYGLKALCLPNTTVQVS